MLAVTAWSGLAIGPASTAALQPGRAYARQPGAVIPMARARQYRRRQRIAQAFADTIPIVGGGAAVGLRHLWRPRAPQPRDDRPGLGGRGPAGLTGINVLGWGCWEGGMGIASDSRHTWVICSDGTMLELAAATGAPVRVLTGPRYRFNNPDAVASDGARVWVANAGSYSVTELDAATGAPIRVLAGPRYQFNGPDAIATDGTRVWVANAGSYSVTELDAATGAPIRVLAGPRYQFNHPAAIAVDGTHVWVANANSLLANAGGGSVTELDAATGAPIRVLTGPRYQFNSPGAMAADGARVWVANAGVQMPAPGGGYSVTELDAATGAPIRVLAGPRYQFNHPVAVAADGARVWVANTGGLIASTNTGELILSAGGGWVTELDAVTGAPVQVLIDFRYQFNDPDAIVADDSGIWVANAGGGSVTEFPAASQ